MRRSRMTVLFAVIALAGLAGRALAAGAGDEAALREVNARMTHAFLESDVAFYEALLTDDFQAVLADGRLIDRKEFLREAAVAPKLHAFQVNDVQVRVYETSAVVTAWVSYKHADETQLRTRYADLYVKVDGRWRLASIQWTRIAPLGTKP